MEKSYHCIVEALGENSSQGLSYRSVPPGSKVLDVGCAVGDMGIALVKNKQCTVWGVEYDPERAECARATGAYRKVFQLDLDTLPDTGIPGLSEQFDCIICGDVLEHLKDPLRALIRLQNHLSGGGQFLLSLPNLAHCSVKCGLLLNEFKYMSEGLLDESHLHFFTWQSIAKLCTEAKLQIVQSRRTYLGLEGFGSPTDYSRLPAAVLQYVFADVHSYVCQYVLTLQATALPEADLAVCNHQAMTCGFDDLPAEIRQYVSAVQQKIGVLPPPPQPKAPSDLCISVRGDGYAPDTSSGVPSLAAHISFFYVPNRLVYLAQEVAGLLTIPNIDIFIHTNQAFEHPMFHDNVHLIVHDLGEMHPFYLTWQSRSYFRKDLDQYDYYLYLEDDIHFTRENFAYFLKYHPVCKANNAHLGFLRVERSNRDGQWYLLDIVRPLQRHLQLGGVKFAVNDVNSYYAMWILDNEELRRFINEFPREFDLSRPFWGNNTQMIREDAAVSPGCILYAQTLVCDDPGANLWHLTNNYVDHDQYYAKLRRDRLLQ